MGFQCGDYPETRLRRVRDKKFVRDLCQETVLGVKDLIYPLFIIDHPHKQEPIPSMPGIFRHGLDSLLREGEKCLEYGVPAVALFPVLNDDLKTPDGRQAYRPDSFLCHYIQALKERLPELGIISDVALDGYTTSGHDGIVDESGNILNDETVRILCEQALCHAQAGVDIVAPSDMMDGRVKKIRETLDRQRYFTTKILSYSAKYCSSLYGPFRQALGSASCLKGMDKKTYQMDFHNRHEALRETHQDIIEGADMVMVKPASFYLDVVALLKSSFKFPTFAYQVSGEYGMLKAACENGWLSEPKAVLESLVSIKRAGADGIFTYYAPQAAKWLQQEIL